MEDTIPKMKQGILKPKLNDKLCRLLLSQERWKTKELLKNFYHVDTYWIDGRSARLQGYIAFSDVPDDLPKWFADAINHTELVLINNTIRFEVWKAIINEELPF